LARGVPRIKNISRKNYALAARAAWEYFLTAFSIPGVAFFQVFEIHCGMNFDVGVERQKPRLSHGWNL